MQERKYLLELAKQYPSRKAVAAEIIRLNGLLNLPKGTEHFLSDIHGIPSGNARFSLSCFVKLFVGVVYQT